MLKTYLVVFFPLLFANAITAAKGGGEGPVGVDCIGLRRGSLGRRHEERMRMLVEESSEDKLEKQKQILANPPKCLEEDQHQPLVQPRVIKSDGPFLNVELRVAPGQVGDLLPCGIRYKSRLYDGTFPGPTISTKRGQLVNVSLINDLGPNLERSYCKNTWHTPNTTNLHVHFIHASPDGDQDNIRLKVDPETIKKYSFPLHPDHASGTGWYHPHYHGSVHFQMYNGMAGTWIMEDEEDREYAQAPELKDMTEYVIVLQSINMNNHTNHMSMTNERFWEYGEANHSNMPVDLENPNNVSFKLLLTNGQYNPKITAKPNEILRLRVVNAVTADSVHFRFDKPGCKMWELSKDSIYLPEPYEAKTVFLAAGSRVDVAIKCAGSDLQEGEIIQVITDLQDERFTIKSKYDGSLLSLGYIWARIPFTSIKENQDQAFLSIEISGGDDDVVQRTLPSKLPDLPSYTQKLIDESARIDAEGIVLEPKHLNFSGPAINATAKNIPKGTPLVHNDVDAIHFRQVNGMLFNESVLLWNQTLGVLDEWHLTNLDDPDTDPINNYLFSHHFHFHTNHYLMMHDDRETNGLFFRKGEIRDTIPFYPTKVGTHIDPPVVIRVLPLDYNGTNIVHCHQADHSDEGMAMHFGMDGTATAESDGATIEYESEISTMTADNGQDNSNDDSGSATTIFTYIYLVASCLWIIIVF